MKKHLCVILIFLAITVWHTFAENIETNEWSATNCDAKISVTLKEPAIEIKTNESVVVTVQIKNTSTNEVLIFLISNVPTDFTWTITSPSGKDLSPKKPAFPADGFSSLIVHVNPMETSKYNFDLSSICNFNEIGTYKVFAKKEVFFISPTRKKGEIVSKPLDIVISK
jgi:hypothetical protein